MKYNKAAFAAILAFCTLTPYAASKSKKNRYYNYAAYLKANEYIDIGGGFACKEDINVEKYTDEISIPLALAKASHDSLNISHAVVNLKELMAQVNTVNSFVNGVFIEDIDYDAKIIITKESYIYDCAQKISSASQRKIRSVQSIQKTSYDSSISSEANSAEYIDNFRDQRDGQSYKLIRIGNTVWMAENLNYAVDAQSFCVNCEIYGRLYTWESAKNACPQGMHPPTESEWNVLAEYYGGQKIAGDKLKSNFQSKLKASFSAKYGGTGSMYGKYDHKNYSDGIIGTWWADPGTSHRIIRSYSSILTREVGDTKSDAHSLRCVQD